MLENQNAQIEVTEDVPIINRNAQTNLVEAETLHFSTYLVAADPANNNNNNNNTVTSFQSGEYFVGNPIYQNIDGKTGKPVDLVPACKFQDPEFHSGKNILTVTEVYKRIADVDE